MGFLVFSSQLGFFFGVKFTTTVNVGIIQPSSSVFTTLLAMIFHLEARSLVKMGGVLLAFSGSLVILHIEDLELHGDYFLGNVLLLSGTLLFSIMVIMQKPLLEHYASLTINTWIFGVAAVLMDIVTAVFYEDVAALQQMTPLYWAGMLYIIVVATVFCYSLYSWALQKSSPTIVSMYVCWQPVATALLSIPVYGVLIDWRMAVGGVLIIAGIIVVTFVKHREAQKKKATELSNSRNVQPAPAVSELANGVTVGGMQTNSKVLEGECVPLKELPSQIEEA